jgi:hypothetical protein
MANTAQVNRILSEVNGLDERAKIEFFQKIDEIYQNFDIQHSENVSLESAFGLWKDRNVTKESLRQKAWKTN